MRVAFFCARGGSKGVPRKNLWVLENETLLARTVRQAQESGVFDAIAVSSDADAILSQGRRAGADHCLPRPVHLASDEASTLAVLRHALGEVDTREARVADVIVDFDVTTPLRSAQDIRNVVAEPEAAPNNVEAILTCWPARRSPYFNLVVVGEDGIPVLPCSSSVVRRQDGPTVYDLSGAMHARRRAALLRDGPLLNPHVRLHVMPVERAWDIYSEIDRTIILSLLAAQV